MFNKEAEFEKEIKECEGNDYCKDNKDNDYCTDEVIQQTYQQRIETGYNKATGDPKKIIKNLLDVLMCLGGARVADMDTVKEAKQYLKEGW